MLCFSMGKFHILEEDINLYKQYIGIADEFLFDSSAMEKSSIFDWNYLKNIEISEWFLAGGININNLEKASKISKFKGSGFMLSGASIIL